jgi:hypothetical protein
MNREIKFRAYCEKHNRWEVYTLGDLICGNATSENEEGGVFTNWCQCTGLQDRDGKDIFENDILTVVGKKYTVEFKNGMFGVMINNNTKFIDLYWWIKENKKANNNYKIIGNKFDKEED